MVLIVLVLILGLLIGAGLVVWGWRGRRVDDHPWCVHCRFDLFGLSAESASCPECGADTRKVGAVRWGQRRRRGVPLITGGILLLVSGGLLCSAAFSDTEKQHLVPVWWLWRDVEVGSPQRADVAFNELIRRTEVGRLDHSQLVDAALKALAIEDAAPLGSPSNVNCIILAHNAIRSLHDSMDHNALDAATLMPLIDHLLKRAKRSDVRWSSHFGALLEYADEKGWIPREEWSAYIENCIEAELNVRRTVALGDPLIFLYGMASKFGSSRFTAECELLEVHIDGNALDDLSSLEVIREVNLSPPLVLTTRSILPDQIDPEILTAGTHVLEVRLRIKLYDGPPDQKENLATVRDASLSVGFTVLPAGESSVRLHTIDSNSLHELRRILTPRLRTAPADTTAWLVVLPNSGFDIRPGFPSVFRPGPTRPGSTYDLRVQIGEESPIGVGPVMIPSGSIEPMAFPYPGPPPKPGDTVRFIFKPNPELAKRTIDVHDIWGEEIIFEQTYRSPTTPRRGISPSPD